MKIFDTKVQINSYIKSISLVYENCYKVEVFVDQSYIKSIRPCAFFKIYFNDCKFKTKPMPMYLCDVNLQDSLLIFYVYNNGHSSNILLKNGFGKKIDIVGPNGIIIQDNVKNIYIITDCIHLNAFLYLLKLPQYNVNITIVDNEINNDCISYHKIKYINYIDNNLIENADLILKACDVKIEYNKKIFNHLNTKMQCMMGGICGKCIFMKNNDVIYSCIEQFKN
jgi:hypothetical protein